MSFDLMSGGRFPTYIRQSLLPAGPRSTPPDMLLQTLTEVSKLATKLPPAEKGASVVQCMYDTTGN